MTYFESISDKKDILDLLLKKYRGQPVGIWYIDIIMKKENIFDFINELSLNWFLIIWVTWWFYCESLEECPLIWMWWPKSIFYKWWFAEIWYWYDFLDTIVIEKLKLSNSREKIRVENKEFSKIIIEKQISSIPYQLTLDFKDIPLIPSIRLLVLNEWKNIVRNEGV